jgi:Domain of unknown function (DUF4907)
MLKYFFPLLIVICSCSSSVEDTIEDKPVEPASAAKPSYKIVYYDNVGWGYQIFIGSNLIINQKHIPAVQGVKGFSSEAKAKIAAEYVLNLVEQGNMQPRMSVELLDSLQVL